ncbi:MAG: hypothetical protein M0R33_04940 [Methylomonas sp.]|uniref:hypothetical protein n=1 Tax=Methylomonas sp. TaxID=418 RepID=UPI0025D968F7|nr:hypothetical protein [Methylomonas sp.]MCK9605781.1 hypothetical protein [Methylomonas sp.]
MMPVTSTGKATMQITLLRCGKPAVHLSGMSGILDRPPPEILAGLSHANYVVRSDLARWGLPICRWWIACFANRRCRLSAAKLIACVIGLFKGYE